MLRAKYFAHKRADHDELCERESLSGALPPAANYFAQVKNGISDDVNVMSRTRVQGRTRVEARNASCVRQTAEEQATDFRCRPPESSHVHTFSRSDTAADRQKRLVCTNFRALTPLPTARSVSCRLVRRNFSRSDTATTHTVFRL